MKPDQRIAQLREELNFHLYRYHVLDSPVIVGGVHAPGGAASHCAGYNH
jgi:hypothetical protein